MWYFNCWCTLEKWSGSMTKGNIMYCVLYRVNVGEDGMAMRGKGGAIH